MTIDYHAAHTLGPDGTGHDVVLRWDKHDGWSVVTPERRRSFASHASAYTAYRRALTKLRRSGHQMITETVTSWDDAASSFVSQVRHLR